MVVIIYIIALLLLLYTGFCAFYYYFQEKLIFVPGGGWHSTVPLALGSEFSEHMIDSAEGGRIHAIHIKSRSERGCILYFHGNTGSMSRWAPIAEELTSYGFDVFLPCYRGYGQSTGPRSEELLYADALASYKWLRERYNENQICLYGRSLGSGPAAWLAGRTKPGAVVLETPFNNMIEVAAYHSKIIPVKLFLRYTFRNDIHIKACTSPVLIAHGTKDRIVPYKLGLALYNTIKSTVPALMLTIPGGRHGNLNTYPVFTNGLERFLHANFAKGQAPTHQEG